MNDNEYFVSGHKACAGCSVPILVRWVLKIAGPDTFVVNATGCLEVFSTPYPYTSWKVPWIHTAFENSAATATGIDASIKRKGLLNAHIIVFAGDGATSDIGLQALSGMAERGNDVLYIMYDNEAYMNTGIQRSSATPYGAWTTTSEIGTENLIGKKEKKKPITDIMVAHNIPYAATVNIAFFNDFKDKIKKALGIKGTRFINALAGCPTGWKHDPSKTVEVMKLATRTGIFPLYEVVNGQMRITYRQDPRIPVGDYIKVQGRFKHLQNNHAVIDEIQKNVDSWWSKY
ncbi:MAG: thiamine pyrophosphate-dependent enzyme [Candidatus Thermoplasmatota archaeon]|jgi:pyruvate ferredoxin oxidoreductase beta subunit|nr:thiamine pyrophosphate-dependent enzyme [Candidatus Thermoplasmatota archaeon]MCL5963422.1 thiamine pyrophosphate-dependent enzyme [Candidatus Thermoplasmatota archaeon]